MREDIAEKFAALLGESAVTGDTGTLQKEAAAQQLTKAASYSPLIGAGIGAGLGGLSGYLSSEKEKEKNRNALYGALIGALGGGGAGLVYDARKTPAANGALDAVDKSAPTDLTTNNKSMANYLGWGRAGVAASGGLGVSRLSGRTFDKYVSDPNGWGRGGELSRLAADKPKILDRVLGRNSNPYTTPIQRFLEAHGPANKPLATSLNAAPAHPGATPPKPILPKDPSLNPGFIAGHPNANAAMDEYYKALARHPRNVDDWKTLAADWNEKLRAHQAGKAELPGKLQAAEELLRTQSAGGTANRAKNIKILEEILANRGLKSPTGTLHTDLDKVRKYTLPQNAARYGVRGITGIGSGLLFNTLGGIAQNLLARQLSAAPTPTPATDK